MNDNGGLATGISRQIFADLSVLCTLARLDGVRATVALQEECHDDVAAGVPNAWKPPVTKHIIITTRLGSSLIYQG